MDIPNRFVELLAQSWADRCIRHHKEALKSQQTKVAPADCRQLRPHTKTCNHRSTL